VVFANSKDKDVQDKLKDTHNTANSPSSVNSN